MPRLFHTLILLSSLLILDTVIADDDDSGHAKHPTLDHSSDDILNLDSQAQQLADIRTQPLRAASNAPEYQTFGSVVAMDGLLGMRQQYLSNLTQQQSANAKNTEAQLNLSRTRQLHQQDIVSNRRLQEQQAQAQTEKALLDASHYQQEILLNNCRMEWGNTLCQWLSDIHGQQLQALLTQQAQLIQVTLPPGKSLPPASQPIMIDESGRRDSAIQATLIAQAPRVDPITQGLRYFFKISQRTIAYGSHLTAWIAETGRELPGVSVPRSSIVRHAGQNWVFIKTGETQFQRYSLPDLAPIQTCCFNTKILRAGDEVVVTGAQTLLSQQLNHQIPEENDD